MLMIPVVAPSHPLAQAKGRVPSKRLAEHVQIVTSERTREGVPDRAVLSPLTWRVADLHTKHALLRAGLGWGRLPGHIAAEDLERGTLVRVRPEAWGDADHQLALAVVHRQDAMLGPAARWLVERLGQLCRDEPPTSVAPSATATSVAPSATATSVAPSATARKRRKR